MKFLYLIVSTFLLSTLVAQQIAPLNGVKESRSKLIALKNARIIVSPTKTIEKGTILIENDRIVKVGFLVIIPEEALVYDYAGKTIVPVFIETNSSLGMSKLESKRSFFPQIETNKDGAFYWNESVHPEVSANEFYVFDKKSIEEMHKKGFGVVSTRQNDGICQGFSAIYSLGLTNLNKQLISFNTSSYFSFKKGVSAQTYPSSEMGSIALMRQAFYDARWYANDVKKDKNISLEALNIQFQKNMLFSSSDRLEILRAQKIAKEFNLNFTYIGSGNEYELLEELKKEKHTLILPLNFPEAFDVKDPYQSKEIPLSDLKTWELSSKNPAILKSNKINFALSSEGLTSANFWTNLHLAIENGLKKDDALEALTLIPAKILGIEADFGSLDEGKKASFIVYDENPFEEKTKVLESWILGEQHVFQVAQEFDIRGKYNMILDNEYLLLEIGGTKENLTAKIKKRNTSNSQVEKNILKKFKRNSKDLPKDTLEATCFIKFSGLDLNLQFKSDELKWNGSISLQAKYKEKFALFEGDALLDNGTWGKWSAIRSDKADKDKKPKEKEQEDDKDVKVWFPNMAFGFVEKPSQETILIKNAQIWTNEKDGIIENGSLLIEKGKIKQVLRGDLPAPSNARIIDAKGKFVTSGIIDEHSHIAISKGVNEGGQAISAEVSIGDVVRSDDIEIYRQLSGGVTAAQLLHGSANPIGGQSALIKLKWGHTPEEMLIPNAPKFIKFALGENVKQTNWGDFNRIRFPQTRMGVEQIMYDAFDRARKYEAEKLNTPTTFRKDLELEVLLEILKSERFITCHSYVQSELLMLMNVADSLKFKLNTFTHILEGYKVADKMKSHGVGASTFADWWAYKYEVNDAIPYNAALLTKMGIITAINSDDAEMGRRLNQEAAKTVKYGGMSEEEAWKMVTLNPAKLLHLDDRMGSIKIGKDADIVIWTANPLSIEAKVETTIVDGEVLFDVKRDLEMQIRDAAERAKIISKMVGKAEKGAPTKKFEKKRAAHFHCNTLGEAGSEGSNEH